MPKLSEMRLNRPGDYIDAFREQFDRAVSAAFVGDGPVGALLSGGMDSTSIVCSARSARRRHEGPLSVFSAVSDVNPECPETRCVSRMAGMDGLLARQFRTSQVAGRAEALLDMARAAQNPG